MSVYKPEKSPFFHYDFQFRGERFHGSTGKKERRAAEAVEKAERKRLEHLANQQGTVKGRVRDMTFDAAALKYWEQKGQHADSKDEIWTNLTRLVSWIGKDTMLSEIDDARLSELVAKRRLDYRWGKPELGPVTNAQVNRSVTQLLKRILTRARTVWKIPLPDEPQWRAHLLEEKNRVREMDFEEEAKIEGVEQDDYRPARLFALATALRRREVVGLTWEQVDWAGGVIRVVGKGDKPHEIPITPEITEILWPLRGHHPVHVFTFEASRTRQCARSKRKYMKGQRYPITYWGWGTRFRRDMAKAGVKNFRIHDLRHTSATRTLRASKNMRAVQELLNHSSMTVTQRYSHAMKEDVADAMKARREDEARRRAEHDRRTKSRKSPGTAKTKNSKSRKNKEEFPSD